MLRLKNVAIARGNNILLQDINLSIFAKQKIGLIGNNGSGKSSLFAVLRHELEISRGEFEVEKGLRIAHMQQEMPGISDSAVDFVASGDLEVAKINENLTAAEENGDMDTIMDCHTRLSEIDGYAVQSRAAKILHGLGFSDKQLAQNVGEFSGGYRMRINLARCLMMPADLLLLDEPTNHLDLPAILWLEKWVQRFNGCVIIISHDKAFLDNTITKIFHIENQNIVEYGGNYSLFEEQRAERLAQANAQFVKQQKAIDHMMDYVNRFRYKSSKARQAQSRLKAIDRMQKLAPIYESLSFKFEFLEPKQMPQPLIKMDKVSIGYDNQALLSKIKMSLMPNARLALLGKNGQGKSTFLKAILGELPPLQGELSIMPGVAFGYFAQHHVDSLDKNATPFELVQDLDRKASTQAIRNFLGSFQFQSDRVFENIRNFSGGEKARLTLALLVWQRPNLLLLDEPTNHLDMAMRDAVTLALQSFPGAVILVSHDRELITSVADELWLVDEGTVRLFDGDLADYQAFLMQD